MMVKVMHVASACFHHDGFHTYTENTRFHGSGVKLLVPKCVYYFLQLSFENSEFVTLLNLLPDGRATVEALRVVTTSPVIALHAYLDTHIVVALVVVPPTEGGTAVTREGCSNTSTQ
jgi:hypothetical protein